MLVARPHTVSRGTLDVDEGILAPVSFQDLLLLESLAKPGCRRKAHASRSRSRALQGLVDEGPNVHALALGIILLQRAPMIGAIPTKKAQSKGPGHLVEGALRG